MKLNEKAMLVSLSISQWAARKQDKKAAAAVRDKYGNSEESGRYTKSLVAREAILKVSKCASAARATHYKNTLPWDDENRRILTTANYQSYTELMREHRKDFDRAVHSFIDNYPYLVQQAKLELNGLFNPDEYPTPEKIKEKYKLDVTVDPLPDKDDFRVNLNDEDVDQIRQEMTERADNAQKRAMGELWERVHGAVSKMAETLKEPEAIFRDSLVGNLKELCDLLPRLNITDDENLENLRREIEDRLLAYSPKELRDSNDNSVFESPRKDTAQAADEIMKKMAAYMG